MSTRNVPEVTACGKTETALAMRSYRYRLRALDAANRGRFARAKMLESMSHVYAAWGLAQSHQNFGSDTHVALRIDATRALNQLRRELGMDSTKTYLSEAA